MFSRHWGKSLFHIDQPNENTVFGSLRFRIHSRNIHTRFISLSSNYFNIFSKEKCPSILLGTSRLPRSRPLSQKVQEE